MRRALATSARAALATAFMATMGLATPPACAQEVAPRSVPYTLSGEASFSGMALWTDDGEYQAADLRWGSDAALGLTLGVRRPGIRAEFSGQVDAMTGTAAAAPLAGAMAAAGAFVAAAADGSYAAAVSIERAYLKWTPGPLSITAGRQVINWGGALLWSPADLFAETTLVGLAPERAGTDALRVALPLGALGGLEAAAVPAASFSEGRYGGRLYGYALGSDFGLQAAWDGASGSTTVAANLKTDLIVGVWAEVAYTTFDAPDTAREAAAVIGADWSIGSKLIVSGEYHFELDIAEGAGDFSGAAHRLYTSASVKAGDFASLGCMLVADLAAGIASGTASAVVDVAQDASLTVWMQYASGSTATLAGTGSAGAGVTLSLAF